MNETQNDHDLLIQIATKLDRAISDIKELKDNTTARVSALEEEKVNRSEFNDLKQNFEDYKKSAIASNSKIQRLVYIGVGIVITLNAIISLYIVYKH